jgi:ligand-binding sensor domain-containing protein
MMESLRRRNIFHNPRAITLIAFLIFFHSGGGQEKIAEHDKGNEPSGVTKGHPKLIKTQGSNQYANVRCGMQDRTGNLWFGTAGEGVYRYDGKLFYQFTMKDGLSNNNVWSVLEDRSGNIWFGTTDGVCRYDGKTISRITINDRFMNPISDNNYYNDWSTKNTVWSMLQDKAGNIWLGTGDGVYCYNHNTFARFPGFGNVINKEGLLLKMVDCMIQDKAGNIWFASGMPPGSEGLCVYDGKSLTRFKPGGDGWIRYVLEDKNGVIWSAGRHKGNWCYDGKTFSKFTAKEDIGNAILADRAGNIWFSGEEHRNGLEGTDGVWRYDGKNFKNFNTKDGMGNYGVWTIIEDRAGNIWFGTRNTGLYKYDGKTFTGYSE